MHGELLRSFKLNTIGIPRNLKRCQLARVHFRRFLHKMEGVHQSIWTYYDKDDTPHPYEMEVHYTGDGKCVPLTPQTPTPSPKPQTPSTRHPKPLTLHASRSTLTSISLEKIEEGGGGQGLVGVVERPRQSTLREVPHTGDLQLLEDPVPLSQPPRTAQPPSTRTPAGTRPEVERRRTAREEHDKLPGPKIPTVLGRYYEREYNARSIKI